jgi:hypothetical protein
VSSVSQHPTHTAFGFESGCQLRIKILPAQPSDKNEVKR